MYYYVLQSPQTRGARQVYQQLRDTLTRLGIAGEIVTSSPARTPAEQAYIGVTKGYSTVVAVGDDAHINEVAMAVIGRAVLGIIPMNASSQVVELVGTSNINAAAESLKHRRISMQDTLIVDPDLPLFLDGVIKSNKLAKASLVIDNKVRVHAYFNELIVTRSLHLHVRSLYQAEAKKVLGLFKVGGEQIVSESSFHGRQIRVNTEPGLPLKVGDTKIADSPFSLRLMPQSLKVITKRGTVLE